MFLVRVCPWDVVFKVKRQVKRMEQEDVISLGDLDEQVEKLKRSISSMECSYQGSLIDRTEEDKCRIVRRWMAELTTARIKNLIVHAKAMGENSVVILRDKWVDDVSYSDVFYTRVKGEDLSIKEKIESLVNLREMRPTFGINNRKPEVTLHWRYLWLPDILLRSDDFLIITELVLIAVFLVVIAFF